MEYVKFYYIHAEALNDEKIEPYSLYYFYDTLEMYYDDGLGYRRKMINTYIYPTELSRLNSYDIEPDTLYIVAENSKIYIYDFSKGWLRLGREAFYYFEVPYITLNGHLDNDNTLIYYAATCIDRRIKRNSNIEFIPDPSIYDITSNFTITCTTVDGECTIILKMNRPQPVNIEDEKGNFKFPELYGRMICHNGQESQYSLKPDVVLETATVSWVNWDNTLLFMMTYIVNEGVPPEDRYDPSLIPNLLPKNTEYKVYEFSRWNKVIDENKNVVYSLEFNEYDILTVEWIANGVLTHTLKYLSNENPPDDSYFGNADNYENRNFNYIFDSWLKEQDEIGNIKYIAQYTAIAKTLVATWINYNGDIIRTQNYLSTDGEPNPDVEFYSDVVIVPPDDETYTYGFMHWNAEITQKGVNYTPEYMSILIVTRVLNFINTDGSVISQILFKSNQDIPTPDQYNGDTPINTEIDEGYVYQFSKWDNLQVHTDELGNISYSYLALYNKVRICTVKWMNHNSTITLKEDTFLENESVPESYLYDGDEPVREDTDTYTYSFAMWSANISHDGDVTYIPIFNITNKNDPLTPVKTLLAIWKNYDGSILYSVQWISNESAPEADTYTEIPVKELNDGYIYTFSSWDTEVDEDENVIYIASYVQVRILTATWYDINMNILYTTEFLSTDKPVTSDEFPYDEPVKEEDDIYTYEFNGWTRSEDEVGNISYIISYTSNPKSYKVEWIMDDDSLLYSTIYLADSVPPGPNDSPLGDRVNKPYTEDPEHTYVFDKWIETKDGMNIQYKASFIIARYLYATWVDYTGKNIIMGIYLSTDENPPDPHSADKTACFIPLDNETTHYEFIRWDSEILENGIKYIPYYDSITRPSDTTETYKVEWVDWNETVLYRMYISDPEIASTIEYPFKNPSRADDSDYIYTFSKWDFTSDDTGALFTAHFDATAKPSVTWIDRGEIIYTQKFRPNQVNNISENYISYTPSAWDTREFEYTFDRWIKSVDEEGNVIYTANYIETERILIATWVDVDNSVLYSLEYTASTPPDPIADYIGEEPEDPENYAWNTIEIVEGILFQRYSLTTKILRKWYNVSTELEPIFKKEYYTIDIISAEDYEYDIPSYPESLIEDGLDSSNYIFTGWREETLESGEVCYIAEYELQYKTYTITWIIEDAHLIFNQSLLSQISQKDYKDINELPDSLDYDNTGIIIGVDEEAVTTFVTDSIGAMNDMPTGITYTPIRWSRVSDESDIIYKLIWDMEY